MYAADLRVYAVFFADTFSQLNSHFPNTFTMFDKPVLAFVLYLCLKPHGKNDEEALKMWLMLRKGVYINLNHDIFLNLTK